MWCNSPVVVVLQPAEWIAVMEALDKIFAQNSVAAALDWENVIHTILRGDLWTAFESRVVYLNLFLQSGE